eukprot:TRINITY_DN124_c0_g1_i7.p1 TRINITY_DN124_c0_g1~~TRINITY_DN124_c0_g1_i7.p1  ORF type:complete len:111 (+),score=33.55 TRINITY_DN124_c0_g1_i7:83-415(+)
MIRRPPRSTLSSSSAASDVYKRQGINAEYGDQLEVPWGVDSHRSPQRIPGSKDLRRRQPAEGNLSLIHISEPTRLLSISYAVFCLKKKKKKKIKKNVYMIKLIRKNIKEK